MHVRHASGDSASNETFHAEDLVFCNQTSRRPDGIANWDGVRAFSVCAESGSWGSRCTVGLIQ